jgi:hypothetical protein
MDHVRKDPFQPMILKTHQGEEQQRGLRSRPCAPSATLLLLLQELKLRGTALGIISARRASSFALTKATSDEPWLRK